jgi:hypothetical protein
MSYLLKLPLFAVVYLIGAICALAQGTLESDLLPFGPSIPPLAGHAYIVAPDTSSSGPLYSVAFQVVINTNQVVFTTGRIFGGSTAWAFSLGSATINGGEMWFVGATDMTANQINDMLADNTQLEVLDEFGGSAYLKGSLHPTPEPRVSLLLLAGFWLLRLRWKHNRD